MRPINTVKKCALSAVAGILIGLFTYSKFLAPEATTSYIERTVIDTIYTEAKTIIEFQTIKARDLSDSVAFYKKKYAEELANNKITITEDSDEPFSAPLRKFFGSETYLHGNMRFEATVAGELLDVKLFNDFKYPTIRSVTNKESQTVYKPSGIYLTGGFSTGAQLSPLIGGAYLKDKAMIFYNYNINNGGHTAGIGVKLLGK
jgi:hypothetical protein